MYSDGAVGHIVPAGSDSTICGEHSVRELLPGDPNEAMCPDCSNGVRWGRLGGSAGLTRCVLALGSASRVLIFDP